MSRIARWIRVAEKKRRLVKGLEQVLRVIEGFERGQGSQFGRHVAKRKLEEMMAQQAQEEWVREELIDLHDLLGRFDGTEEMVQGAGKRIRTLIKDMFVSRRIGKKIKR